MLDRVREATTGAILGVMALQVASSLVVNIFVLRGEIGTALRCLHSTTYGLVEPTLLASLILLVLVVGIGIFGLACFRPADVGLTRSGFPRAVGVVVGYWVVVQVVFVLIGILRDKTLTRDLAWSELGAGFVVGGFMAQILGNALAEEVVFRGFLFPQLWVKAHRRMEGGPAIVVAALASQSVFALGHLPNRLLVKGIEFGVDLWIDQIGLLVGGLIFTILYVASRNLFVVIGIHALTNDPMNVFRRPDDVEGELAVVLLMLALAVVLYLLRRQPSRG